MTEAEAKKKWCPFARGGTYCRIGDVENGDTGNRSKDGGPSPIALCIGSQCMAWVATTEDRGMHGTHVPNGGYCGLVGKP